jgi:hypothetical protein
MLFGEAPHDRLPALARPQHGLRHDLVKQQRNVRRDAVGQPEVGQRRTRHRRGSQCVAL